MKRVFASVLMAMSVLMVGCVPNNQKPQMTPLEIQSLQTREYEADKKVVFASVVSVFQDLGYTIENADLDTGLIRAQSSAKSSGIGYTLMWGGSKVQQTAASAFVESFAGVSKVRLNFVEKTKTSSAYGMTDSNDNAILDAKVYQNAFEKIESAIFIRSAD